MLAQVGTTSSYSAIFSNGNSAQRGYGGGEGISTVEKLLWYACDGLRGVEPGRGLGAF